MAEKLDSLHSDLIIYNVYIQAEHRPQSSITQTTCDVTYCYGTRDTDNEILVHNLYIEPMSFRV